MQELLNQFYGYVRGIWARRWYLMATMWFVCVVGWGVVMTLPSQYEASAKVYVDTRSMLRPLLRGLASESDVEREVALLTRTFLTRPNLEKVAQMTDMDLQAKTPEQMTLLIEQLSSRIEFEKTGQENLYTITYEDITPEAARRVVQALLTMFVEGALGGSRQDTDMAQRFLDEQIADYEKRLVEAEDRLKEFKQRNVGMMPSEGGDYYAKLQQAMQELSQAELQYSEAVNRRNKLKSQLADEEDTIEGDLLSGQTATTVATPLDGRIEAMKSRLDEMLLKYTDRHPDVRELKSQIADLEAQRQAQVNTILSKQAGTARSVNPVFQQIKISLGEAEATVAALQARVGQYRARVGQLRGMMNTMPEVEAELQRLNRDYAVVKENYDTLLSRRESARMGQQAEEKGEGVRFRVIEPPRLPTAPAGPNRMLFLSMVLLGGLVAGLVLALILSQVRATFANRMALREATGLPVFGVISMEWTPAQRMRMRIEVIAFAAMGFLLLLAYAVLMVISFKM